MHKKISILSFTVILTLSSGLAVRAADKTPEQLVKEAKAEIREVSIHDVKKMIDAREKVIILDIRDKDEYEKEHISGAIHISRGLLEFQVHEIIPDKNAKIVVY